MPRSERGSRPRRLRNFNVDCAVDDASSAFHCYCITCNELFRLLFAKTNNDVFVFSFSRFFCFFRSSLRPVSLCANRLCNAIEWRSAYAIGIVNRTHPSADRGEQAN